MNEEEKRRLIAKRNRQRQLMAQRKQQQQSGNKANQKSNQPEERGMAAEMIGWTYNSLAGWFAKIVYLKQVSSFRKSIRNRNYNEWRVKFGDGRDRNHQIKITLLIYSGVLSLSLIFALFHHYTFMMIMLVAGVLMINVLYSLNRPKIIKVVQRDYLNDKFGNMKISPTQFYCEYPMRQYRKIVLLEEFFSDSAVSGRFDAHVDDSGGLKVVKNNVFGPLLAFRIDNEFKRHEVQTVDDYDFIQFYLLPQTNSQLGSYFYSIEGQVYQSLDALFGFKSKNDLVNILKKDKNLGLAYAETEEAAELQQEQQLTDQQARARVRYRWSVSRLAEQRGLPNKLAEILTYIFFHHDDLGYSAWDLNNEGFTGNNDYLKLRMRLDGSTTISDARKTLGLVASNTRVTPTIEKIPSDSGSFYLFFILNKVMNSSHMEFDDVKSDGEKGQLTIGRGRIGDVVTTIPRGDRPLFALIGGISRSGKSTFANRMISTLLYLQDSKGVFDYSDVFIGSVKPEDYISNGYQQAGMMVKGDPESIYQMLVLVDKIATGRVDKFVKSGAINIKQFNKSHPDAKMGKILVVLDEYANTLSRAGNAKIENDDGDKIKLADAIEALALKISQEHGSRGVSMIVITQNFQKSALGKLADGLGSRFLGYANANVWNSLDPSQEMANYMKDLKEDRKGLFFVNAPDFKPISPVQSFESGYIETRTNFIDTSEIKAGFDRKFNTSNKYGSEEVAAESDNKSKSENKSEYEYSTATNKDVDNAAGVDRDKLDMINEWLNNMDN
ncbi:hypothetical protein [Levilactobacillus tujiorum]|uniref:hypothetical protein n=1 Tax=Levilactobacillus tujiorum TaxID=2912243 RepID=UPI001456CD16|nr:hypothetical protein [Levilactobacillus tujiorum]NLR32797.1 hypothetical protein [Levilactobacillus tujiorum]